MGESEDSEGELSGEFDDDENGKAPRRRSKKVTEGRKFKCD